MNELKGFVFATPPRTGTTWFYDALCAVGLDHGISKANVVYPFPTGEERLKVTLVRHPCAWLASYWVNILPGYVGVPAVDAFRRLPTHDFDEFIRQYLIQFPGGVGQMFFSYQAGCYLRTEDFPLNVVEFFGALDIPYHTRRKCLSLSRTNQSRRPLPEWNPSLRERVLRAERAMLEHFDYGRQDSFGSRPSHRPAKLQRPQRSAAER